jgi:hypothetical protein
MFLGVWLPWDLPILSRTQNEIRLLIHPLLPGIGKRSFRELPAPRQLRLTACS